MEFPNWAEPTVRWLFFNVILSLLPLIASVFHFFIWKVGNIWPRLFREGELLVFSTTLSATTIGFITYQKMKIDFQVTFTIIILSLIILSSTFLFAVVNFFKAKGNLNELEEGEKRLSTISILFAVISAAFSLWIFLAGGGK